MKVTLFPGMVFQERSFSEKIKAQLVKTDGYKYFTRYSARANLLGEQRYAINNHENL